MVWTWQVSIRTSNLPTTFCGRSGEFTLVSAYSVSRFWFSSNVLTPVFVAAVCLVCLVVTVWLTVAHRHRQQTATTVTQELFSWAALWENTHNKHKRLCAWMQIQHVLPNADYRLCPGGMALYWAVNPLPAMLPSEWKVTHTVLLFVLTVGGATLPQNLQERNQKELLFYHNHSFFFSILHP